MKVNRRKIIELKQKSKNENDISVYDTILDEDILYDKVVSIEEVLSEYPYVYDLTADKTKNFNLENGLCVADTFHSAGISAKNVTLGVPRFSELINVAKNLKTPSMSIMVETAETQDDIDEIACKIESVFLNQIVKSFDILDFIPGESTLEMYRSINDVKLYENKLIRMIIDHEKMNIQRLDTSQLTTIMNISYKDIFCISNSLNDDVVVMDIYMRHDFIHTENEYYRLGKKLMAKTKIKGVPNITKVYTKFDVEEGKWMIETDGINLRKMLCNPDINPTSAISNDPLEVFDILGIEAARSVLLKEIRKVIEFDGSYVNVRHFNTLVDTMTHKGEIMSITRHGINRSETGPLMRCSFEETVDVLNDAAIFNEIDKLNGVTENITVGKMSKVGTGKSGIFFNSQVSECVN